MEPPAAGRARDALRPQLHRMPEAAGEDVLIVLTELVTGRVLLGPSSPGDAIDVRIVLRPGRVRIEVSEDRLRPAGPAPSPYDSGFGLAVIAALSARWGFADEGPFTTWAEIDTTPSR